MISKYIIAQIADVVYQVFPYPPSSSPSLGPREKIKCLSRVEKGDSAFSEGRLKVRQFDRCSCL